MNYLNCFRGYEKKNYNHEDQLTRAFLIILKYVNLAQVAFIDMVRDEMADKNCREIVPPVSHPDSEFTTIETQVCDLRNESLKSENGRLVSIVISDEKLEDQKTVTNSDRAARYDGVMRYAPGWIFVIENKPNKNNIWLEQLDPNIYSGIEIEPNYISLCWKDIIQRFSALLEKKMVYGAEETLLNDFLEYVDMEFPQLNPYNRLSICKDNLYLIRKRCINLMEEVNLGEILYHRGWKNYIAINKNSIKQIALSPETNDDGTWRLDLQLHPGDTMNQARSFFTGVDRGKLLELPSKGWSITPNFHFAFRSSNLVWPIVKVSTENYIDHWLANISTLGQVAKVDLEQYCINLEKLGLISDTDWPKINDKILSTNMPKLNICPGVSLVYTWSKDEAIKLDDAKKLSKDIKSKIIEALATWEYFKEG